MAVSQNGIDNNAAGTATIAAANPNPQYAAVADRQFSRDMLPHRGHLNSVRQCHEKLAIRGI